MFKESNINICTVDMVLDLHPAFFKYPQKRFIL